MMNTLTFSSLGDDDEQRPGRSERSDTRPPMIAVILAVVAALALILSPFVKTSGPADAATVKPRTTVSLTFDDGNANQLAALPALNAQNMKATFYIVSGFVGAPSYMTRANLDTLKAGGQEIGGHTVSHADLATLPADEVRRQICNDRSTLLGWGYAVRSFAYPFASSTPDAEQAAASCGYNSARMLGDIRSRFGCLDCAYAETVPPAEPYYTKALDQVDSTWTLADLKNSVTRAEAAGGWVQFTFHNVCASGCGDLNVTPTVLAQFTSWLAPRATTGNTVVKPVGDVVGGAVKPAVAGPAIPAPTAGANGVVNPGLETDGPNGLPSCWMQGGYGTNTATFATTPNAHTGTRAETVTVSGYSDGDAKVLPAFDLGSCAPAVTAGKTYSMRTWYTSTTVTQFAVYVRNASGGWQYWTSSPWFSASPSYTQAVWQTPAIPAGITGISFGLNIFANGSITTDDYALYDSVGAPPVSPTTSVALKSAVAPPPVTAPVEAHTPTESVTSRGSVSP